MTCVIAIDFETFGGISPKNGFTQLGACVMRISDSKKIESFNEYANQTGYVPEPRCVKEFWEKDDEMKALYKQQQECCAASTSSPYDVICHFMEWIQRVSKTYPDIYIISDNAGFDLGLLRTFSDKHDPLYVFGTYREMVDVSMWYMGFAGKTITTKTLDESSKTVALEALNCCRIKYGLEKITKLPEPDVPHDHHAERDAETIAFYWCFFQREIDTLNKLYDSK
jgi:hypothetical protein